MSNFVHFGFVSLRSKGNSDKKNHPHRHHQKQPTSTEPSAPPMGLAKQASPDYMDADDDFEPITIKIERASPSPGERSNTEMQPLLKTKNGKDASEEDKRESAV